MNNHMNITFFFDEFWDKFSVPINILLKYLQRAVIAQKSSICVNMAVVFQSRWDAMEKHSAPLEAMKWIAVSPWILFSKLKRPKSTI